MVETKGKATKVRERFPNCQALEGTENGRDRGQRYSRQRKISYYQALEGKENTFAHGKGNSRQRKVP